MPSVQQISEKILELANELVVYDNAGEKFNKTLRQLQIDYAEKKISRIQYRSSLQRLLKGKKEEEVKDYYKRRSSSLLNDMGIYVAQIFDIVQPIKPSEIPIRTSKKQPEFLKILKTLEKPKIISKEFKDKSKKELSVGAYYRLSKSERLKYLSDLKVSERDFDKFMRFIKKFRDEGLPEEKEYSVYKSSKYAQIANTYVEKLTIKLNNKYPEFFEPVCEALKPANIKLLSKTYISIMIFSTIISLPIFIGLSYFLFLNIFKAIFLGFLGMIATFAVLYMYPGSVAKTRAKKMKNELVFAVPHMSSVAGSGAPPLQVFKLLVDSKEYKEIGEELKHILNYVNLFGYNLSTAIKVVAKDTPSKELKELLNGVVSIVETGGDLKKYLSDKADDAIRQYRIDQSKYLAQISTYSDVYTGILIAAPLLFIVTLAILERVSPQIGGFTVGTLASMGTFIVLPVLNIIFILFLEMTKSEI